MFLGGGGVPTYHIHINHRKYVLKNEKTLPEELSFPDKILECFASKTSHVSTKLLGDHEEKVYHMFGFTLELSSQLRVLGRTGLD